VSEPGCAKCDIHSANIPNTTPKQKLNTILSKLNRYTPGKTTAVTRKVLPGRSQDKQKDPGKSGSEWIDTFSKLAG